MPNFDDSEMPDEISALKSRFVGLLRAAMRQRALVQTAIVASLCTVAILFLGSVAWRVYCNSSLVPVSFETASGESVSVTAVDSLGNRLATFTAPTTEVLLPNKEIQLDVIASQRLGYKRSVDPSRMKQDAFDDPIIQLKDPQSHRWMLDDVFWTISQDMTRHGASANHCIVLRNDGLSLIETRSGSVLWTFRDPDQIEWGRSVRGSPATFQPDRCAVIKDTNGNGSQEIVFSHPEKAEVLCLDSSDGKQLWRSDLLSSAGVQTTSPALCPIILQEFPGSVDGSTSLAVVVASRDSELALSDRWLVNVDPSDGKTRWHFGSQLVSTGNGALVLSPIASRPVHQHWGQVESRRTRHGSSIDGSFYMNGYSERNTMGGAKNPIETNLRLGTERPFLLKADMASHWCWVDGNHLQVVDPQTGKLLNAWTLPDDCVCPPKLIRNANDKTILLTVHASPTGRTSDFVGWDLELNQQAWKQTIESDFNQLPHSFYSHEQDFPVVVDLDGDGLDEWISSSHVAGLRPPMTPPYGSVMAYRGDNGEAFWEKPFHLPNLDGMIERAIAVSDVHGDGGRDLLFGTRFHGGGVSEGVGCFVDLVSGKTGQRIWHSNVRTESTKQTRRANEMVGMAVFEEQSLIAVETRRGDHPLSAEARSNSTTFLDIATGKEQAFGLGLSARTFSRDTWLEHRIPLTSSYNPRERSKAGRLVGWDYPISSMWSVDRVSPQFCGDLDQDGYQDVIGVLMPPNDREYVLLDGLTGKKRWTKKSATNQYVNWFGLKQDVDNDGIDDLVKLTSNSFDQAPQPTKTAKVKRASNGRKAQAALVEIISGATGKTIHQQSANEKGRVVCLGLFDRGSGKLPLIAYQGVPSKRVTCVDLDNRKVAWTSDSLTGDHQFWFLPKFGQTAWRHAEQVVWFSVMKTPTGNVASFVNAETGDILFQFPLGDKNANGTNWQQVVMPAWIQWGGRELLAIQSISKSDLTNGATGTSLETKTDLWLIDKSLQLVDHWTDTTSTTESAALKSWFASSIRVTYPTVIRTIDNEEFLGIVTNVDGTLGVRLLAWDRDKTSKVTSIRTLTLPIASSSTYSFVSILDCNGDGSSDFVTMSDAGLDCLSITGEVIWHKPSLPPGSEALHTFETMGRKYVFINASASNSRILDLMTGEDCETLRGLPVSYLASDKSSSYGSLVTCDYPNFSTVSAFRQRNVGLVKIRKSGGSIESDPRYLRLFPWVVGAKAIFWTNRETLDPYAWTRILKLAIGVFLIPALVIWNCVQRQFSIRHLLLIATVIAIALALVLADKAEFPTDETGNGYAGALGIACGAAASFIIFTLPLTELGRSRWRRILSLSVYGLFLLAIPLFNLVAFPPGAIQTTYTYKEFWHLFWLALIPTGGVLFLIHSLLFFWGWFSWIARGIAKQFRQRRPRTVRRAAG